MGTRLQNEGNRILNAVNEGQVIALLTLWDKGLIITQESKESLDSVGVPRTTRQELFHILVSQMAFDNIEATYWLDWFLIPE
jgi:hypothetical protein